VIGAGAKVLGPFKVGDNSKIGANSVVIHEVPPNSTVVGIPARAVQKEKREEEMTVDLSHDKLPDPNAKSLQCLLGKIMEMEKTIGKLKKDSLEYDHTDKS